MDISFIDIVLVIPLAYGAFTGYRHGLVREVASLAGFVAAMYAARYFSPQAAVLLGRMVAIDGNVANIVAFAAIFVLVLSGCSILSKMITKLLKMAMLGTANRLLGALFGFFKYLLALGAVIYCVGLADSVLPMDVEETDAVKKSRLYIPVKKTVGAILPYLRLDELSDIISEKGAPQQ